MNKFIRLLPAILIEIFFCASYILYRDGLWMFPYRKDNLTLLFVIGYMVAFSLGYYFINKRTENTKAEIFPINKMARFIIIANLFLLVPYCLCRTGEFFPNVFEALKDLSISYAKATLASNVSYGIMRPIVGASTILVYMLYHVVYFYWEDLNQPLKWMGLAQCMWYYSVDICTGRNKGITVIAIMIVLMYIIKLCRKEHKKGLKSFMLRSLITLLFVGTVPAYFSFSMSDRAQNSAANMELSGQSVKEIVLEGSYDLIVDQYGFLETEIYDDASYNKEFDEYKIKVISGKTPLSIINRYNENADDLIKINPYYADEFTYSYVNLNHPLYKMMPNGLKSLVSLGTYYLCHGFHGLTLALHMPFESCYGVGHLPILHNTIHKLSGIDVYEHTYVYKLNQSGYPVSLKWGTAFLQWASDISFFGVIILMGGIGALVSVLWDEVLNKGKLISLVLLTTLGVNLLFITSWWQPGMSGTDFVLFYGALFAWGAEKIYKHVNTYKKVN